MMTYYEYNGFDQCMEAVPHGGWVERDVADAMWQRIRELEDRLASLTGAIALREGENYD